jgi:hypothetical protein
MLSGPTTRPVKTAGSPRAHLAPQSSNPPVTALKNDPAFHDAGREIAASGRSNGRRPINPCFRAFLRTFFGVFTAKTVFARTPAPDAPPLPSTFAAASQRNAPVRPPLADTHNASVTDHASQSTSHAFEVFFSSHSTLVARHFAFLIYGTGIDFSRNALILKEKRFSNIR